MEARFSCIALVHQLFHQNGAVLPKIKFKSFLEKEYFTDHLLFLSLMSKAKTGRLARTLYSRSFKSTSDSKIAKPFPPEVIFNNQLIPKIYYPVTGAWPRTENRRSVAKREKAERGGCTSESST